MKTSICTAPQARKADQKAIQEYKIPSLLLMEHAAMGCVDILLKQIKENDSIVILCGPGNNGGDGLAIARLLQKECIVYAPKPDSMSDDEKIQWDMIQHQHHITTQDDTDILASIKKADIIIDALFGNGLSRPIEGRYQTFIQACNQSKAKIISIDVPSGLDATSGHALGECIRSDLTISLDCIKTGQLINEGKQAVSSLTCIPIGIPEEIHDTLHTAWLLDSPTAKAWLPKRSNDAHKGTFGKALMVGGSISMHGAITMACMACYQSGIGTLTCMVPSCIQEIIAHKMEFAMNLPAPDHNGFFALEAMKLLDAHKDRYDILSLGNGMGQKEATFQLVQCALNSKTCVLLDADACWSLQKDPSLLEREAPVILTPHLKEMTYLCDRSLAQIMEDPFQAAKEFCARYPNCTLVLKSDTTIIAHQEQMYVLHRPNSALAKGGSGDILCGIITGLYGQSRNALEAAGLGVFIHSLCADIKKDPACILPQDLLQQIPIVFQSLREK